MTPPQGVSTSNWSKALQEFAAAVGKDWVLTSEEDLATYADAYTPFVGEPELQHTASAAVSPTTVEQVQQIVRTANRYRIPIFPVSTGRNLGYGGSSPSYSGSVVVDLKRMNRVLEINVQEGYMVVEPGINFIELYRVFEARNVPYVVSSPQPGWGSPIGNALERGIGTVGDNFSMVHGLEVVLPSGEVLRTGMGAVPNSRLWHNYQYGFGPFIDGLFSQSSLGIVTKAGFWLMPKPEAQQAFTVSSWKTEDMRAIIDALYSLRTHGVISSWGIGSPIRESMATNDGRQPYGVPEVRVLHRRRDGGSAAEWDTLGRDKNIPAVRGTGTARGPASIVKATIEHVRAVVSRIPGVTFEARDMPPPGGRAPGIDFGILAIQPSNRGHYYFSPVFKPTVEDIFGINDTIRRVMQEANDLEMLDNYGWSAGRGTSFQKTMMILMEFLVTDDVALNRRRRDLWKRLVQACGENGWAEYRAPVAFSDTVMNQFSFNNHVLRRFHETVKDAIDPNGILAPGKAGIWPKHLRKA